MVSTRVMFTSHGNIRRKRKAPRVPPKPDSDRMVMKKLREERMRRAGADEQNDTDNQRRDHARNELEYEANLRDNNQNRDASARDEVRLNKDQHGCHDGEEESGSDEEEDGLPPAVLGDTLDEDFYIMDELDDGQGDGDNDN